MLAYNFVEVLLVVIDLAISKQVLEATICPQFVDVCADQDLYESYKPEEEEEDVQDHDCTE